MDASLYKEAEGIFPGDEYALVESGRDTGTVNPIRGEPRVIDLYALKLDGTDRNVRRLTRAADDGRNAHQGVVSSDGRRIAYSMVEAGGVEVIYLIELR